MRKYGQVVVTFAAIAAGTPSHAVEGGGPAYLLGSRDSLSGIVPGPGFYSGVDLITFSGNIEGLSLGGLPIQADTDVDVNLLKLSLTQSFKGSLFGGTPALNINIPFLLPAEISFDAVSGPLEGRHLSDSTSGMGDITITPMIGWHDGFFHYSAAFSIFAPVGSYSTGSVDIADESIDVLSNGKNVWSFQPVVAGTYLNTDTGFEVSGAASLLFSTKNEATDYQTGLAVTFEGAVMQHLPSGLAFGLTGTYYQQLVEDSGSGADDLKEALGAESLKARGIGLGPLVTYSSELFGQQTSFKLKYVHEFAGRRKFETDMFWFNATVAF